MLKVDENSVCWTPAGEIKPGDRIGTHEHNILEQCTGNENAPARASNKVTKVENAGTQEVYDVQVPGSTPSTPTASTCTTAASSNCCPTSPATWVGEPGPYAEHSEEAWRSTGKWLKRVVHTGVRMLDNVIDMNRFPVPEIEEMSLKTRRIGLGVMGWADMLTLLGIRYDSEEALNLAHRLMAFIQNGAHRASANLAEERGRYPAWEGSVYDRPGDPKPMRNSAPVTIAPTGTISIIAGASSGIEPLFALSYARNVMDNTKLVEVNPHFETIARSEGFHSDELMTRLAAAGGLEEMEEIPEWVREVFRTSHEIEPKWHVLMQAAFQAHTDNSVSKTINLHRDATREEVREAYELAFITNCNGITVYRDGSKEGQVLSTKEETGRRQGPTPVERPKTMTGVTERFRTGHGNMYVTLNFGRAGEAFEIFANMGKAGGCDSAQLEAVSRLASMALRSGVDPQEIIHNLEGITCCPAWDSGTQIRSAPDAMAHMLRRHQEPHPEPYRETGQAPGSTDDRTRNGAYGRTRCPDCNTRLEFKEGCEACPAPDCGWNKCY